MKQARCEVVHSFFNRVELAYESLRAAFCDEVDIDHVNERVGQARPYKYYTCRRAVIWDLEQDYHSDLVTALALAVWAADYYGY